MTTLTLNEHLNAAESPQDPEAEMLKTLENELNGARHRCDVALSRMYGIGVIRYVAAEYYQDIIDELRYLLEDIDELSKLVVSARNIIMESESIRAILIGGGLQARSRGLIHLASIEQLNAGELRRVLMLRDRKISEIGEKLGTYNNYARGLLEKRSAGIKSRILMNIAGFPDAGDLPGPINPAILNQLYDDQFNLQYCRNVTDISCHH